LKPKALDCVEVSGNLYLRVDTSINCGSATYGAFKVLDIILVSVYMALPLVWLLLLWNERPDGVGGEASPPNQASPLKYLFGPYKPQFYWCECVEMFRRILLIGALPLMSTKSARRAALGLFFSLISLVMYRESEPFSRPSNNVLVNLKSVPNSLYFCISYI